MQFGCDENKNRIKPTFSGQRATCPYCSSLLIGKCGEIYAWHWQHQKDRNCDPWQDYETQWHRLWKERFPEDWQEVIIEKDGEKHIADVKTRQGVVIEFQNSSISTTVIKVREKFYGKMIWVVNAESFKDQFKIRSVVTQKLAALNRGQSFSSFDDDFHDEYDSIQEIINEINHDITGLERDIKWNNDNIKELNEGLGNIQSIVEKYIERLKNGNSSNLWETCLHLLPYDFDKEIKEDFFLKHKQIIEIQNKIKNEEERYQYIQRLEDYTLEEVEYKVIKYDMIQLSNFHKVKTILKSTSSDLFPEVKAILNQTSFVNLKFCQDEYFFIVNLSGLLISIKESINNSRDEIVKINQEISYIIKTYSELIQSTINKKIEDLENKDNELCGKLAIFEKKLEYNVKYKTEFWENAKNEAAERKKKYQIEIEAKTSKIMNENKGLYTYHWKHERTTWQRAKFPIFFDIGENYLFYKIEEGVFKKVLVKDFLTKYSA